MKGRGALQSSKELAHCRTEVKRHTRVLSGAFPLPSPGVSALLGHTSGHIAPTGILPHATLLRTEILGEDKGKENEGADGLEVSAALRFIPQMTVPKSPLL